MAVAILLPKLGLTMTEGTINEWLVERGATVSVGDPLLMLATDKVDVEVEAESAGLFHPSVEAGATLPPGSVVGWLLEAGEEPPADAAAAPTVEEETAAGPVTLAPVAAAAADIAATGVAPSGRLKASPNARRVAKEHRIDIASVRGTGPGGRIVSEDVEEHVAAASPAKAPIAGAPRVTPLVRKLAAELGVELADVTPSGPEGKLTRSDVQRAATRLSEPLGAAVAPAAFAPTAQPSSRPMSGIRNAIARNMTKSLHEMAQLTLGHEADVTALVAVRAALKAENAAAGRRTPTITDFIVKAAALALREHPTMNSALIDGRIESPGRIDVGVAVSIDDGLLVPVVRNADSRSVGEISAETARLAGAGRAGKLSLPELEGATFVVSSLGTAGIDFFTPIVNPGNAGILGVGRIRDGVRWEGETPRRTDVLTLSLTFDHRVIDGAPAADYLLAVAELLGRPLTLLAG
ncbi:MAG: hypothetical protein QOJ34_3141 [Pseudonocardiales bacterium]|nr:hypothetical protein [Pseudonocardiales bacterium]